MPCDHVSKSSIRDTCGFLLAEIVCMGWSCCTATLGCIQENLCHVDTASVDVAVFCLALMGTDYSSFLEEAARVLKPHGIIWIAEVCRCTDFSSACYSHLRLSTAALCHSI